MGVEQHQQNFSASSDSSSMFFVVKWILKFLIIPVTGTIAIVNMVRAKDFSSNAVVKILLNGALILVWLIVFFMVILPLIRG